MSLSPQIVLAGGGRLGNVMPGLALAEQLHALSPDVDICFVGAGSGAERNLVRTAGYPYTAIPAARQPSGLLESLRYVTHNAAGYVAARWMLGEWQPSLVVCLGGAVSGVMAHAAKACDVPYVFVETNIVASGAARSIGGAAEAVCLAYEKTRFTLPANCPSVVTGAPVAAAFPQAAADPPPEGGQQLLVLNGAAPRGGAFNQAVHDALRGMRDDLGDWRIIHQTGDKQLEITERRYQQSGIDAIVVSHIDQMPSLLSSSDLVVCRSGGSLLAELTCLGVPSILVPDPNSPAQADNARALATVGAAVVAPQDPQASLADQLSSQLAELIHDQVRRERMALAARAAARPTAAVDIAQLCVDLLGIAPLRVAA